MNYEKVVLDFLHVGYGIDARPKSDKRVEIPQTFIKEMGWNKYNKVYISYDGGGEIYVSNDAGFHSANKILVEVAVSKKRIRIPSSFLKKIGFDNKILSFSGAEGVGVGRVGNTRNGINIAEIISTFNPKDINALGKILVGQSKELLLEKDSTVKLEQTNVSTVRPDEDKVWEPEPILLSKTEPLVFRIMGDPYKFTGYWNNKEVVFSKTARGKLSTLLLIPGIQRLKKSFIFGYLLLDKNLFSKMAARVVKNKQRTTAKGVEVIFIYEAFTFDYFKIYENPPEELPKSVIEKCNMLCSDPENFLFKTFRVVEDFTESDAPASVNSNTIEIYKKL